MYRTKGRGRTSNWSGWGAEGVEQTAPGWDEPWGRPIQASSPEQPFVAVNPFEAPKKKRWWGREARLAHEEGEEVQAVKPGPEEDAARQYVSRWQAPLGYDPSAPLDAHPNAFGPRTPPWSAGGSFDRPTAHEEPPVDWPTAYDGPPAHLSLATPGWRVPQRPSVSVPGPAAAQPPPLPLSQAAPGPPAHLSLATPGWRVPQRPSVPVPGPAAPQPPPLPLSHAAPRKSFPLKGVQKQSAAPIQRLYPGVPAESSAPAPQEGSASGSRSSGDISLNTSLLNILRAGHDFDKLHTMLEQLAERAGAVPPPLSMAVEEADVPDSDTGSLSSSSVSEECDWDPVVSTPPPLRRHSSGLSAGRTPSSSCLFHPEAAVGWNADVGSQPSIVQWSPTEPASAAIETPQPAFRQSEMQWLSSIVQRRSKWGAPPTSITQGSDSKLDPSLGSEKPIPPPSILPTATLPLPAVSTTTKSGFRDIVEDILFTSSVLVDTVSRQIYLHFLLRIPSLYFTRVTRIFEDAQLSLPDIKKMARARAEQWNPAENPAWTTTFIQQPNLKEPLPRSLLIFRANWENFIDDLMSEWQTLNIISVLLMSAILTMLQIDAASHPITRTSALFSLICALMSLLYGCLYIIRFGTMRKMHKASSFADEAQKSTTSIWWNVWVLLAMPAVWLAWAIVVFFVCIMSFVWLSGSSNNPSTFASSPRAALGIRIALTVVFSLGLIYFMLIVRTFHRYGDLLDREWMRRVNEWSKEVWSAPQARPVPTPYPLPPDLPPRKLVPRSPLIKPKKRTVLSPDDGKPIPVEVLPEIKEEQKFDKVPDFVPLTSPPPEFFKPFGPVLHPSGLGGESHRVMQLGYHDVEARQSSGEPPSWAQTIEWGDLNRFAVDISNAWNGRIALDYEDAVSGYHDTRELPAYTLVSAARLDTPLPDEGDPLVNFADLGQETASESGSSSSSYGNVIEPTDNTLGRPEASASSSDSASPPLVVQTHSHSPSPPGTPPVNTRALSRSLSPPPPSRPPDNYIDSTLVETVREFVALWNEWYFHPRNIEASLVLLESPEPGGFVYAINLGMRPPMLEPIMRQKDDQEEAEPAGKSGGKAGTVRDPESSGPQIG